MENEKTKIISSAGIETKEINRVVLFLERETSFLEEDITLLAEKLKPILGSKTPGTVSEDRGKMDTELGEQLQKEVDKIISLRDIIKNLIDRIAI